MPLGIADSVSRRRLPGPALVHWLSSVQHLRHRVGKPLHGGRLRMRRRRLRARSSRGHLLAAPVFVADRSRVVAASSPLLSHLSHVVVCKLALVDLLGPLGSNSVAHGD